MRLPRLLLTAGCLSLLLTFQAGTNQADEETKDPRLLLTIKSGSGSVGSVAFSPDGKRIVGAVNKTIKIWNAEDGKEVASFPAHDDPIQTVAFSSDGKRIVSAAYDRTVKVWNAETLKEAMPELALSDWPHFAAFRPDGKRVIGGGDDKAVRIWDAVKGERLGYLKHPDQVKCAQYSPDGKRIASGCSDKQLRVWDAENREQLFEREAHAGPGGHPDESACFGATEPPPSAETPAKVQLEILETPSFPFP
jgi:WD40 repeat protein